MKHEIRRKSIAVTFYRLNQYLRCDSIKRGKVRTENYLLTANQQDLVVYRICVSECFPHDVNQITYRCIALPTATRLGRLDPSGEAARYFDELRARQRIVASISGTLGLMALLAGEDFFATPSVGVEIERPYDLDVDNAADLSLAEALVSQGIVQLPHMDLKVVDRGPSRYQAPRATTISTSPEIK